MNCRRFLILGILLVIGQVLATSFIGLPAEPVLAPDSGFYLDGAERFPFLIAKQRPYLGMIIYLKLCGLFGSASWASLLFNSAVILIAAEALWQISSRWCGSSAGWIASSLWLLNPLTAQWTRYVLTEPLFFSAVLFWLWLALFRHGFFLIAFSAVAATLRPNGFTLLAAALSWVAVDNAGYRKRAICLVVAGWISLITAVVVVAPWISPVAHNVPQYIANGTVIHSHPELDLAMVGPFAIPRLMLTRLAWEFGQWRPWYSLRFNIFIGVLMTGFYVLALRGAWLTRSTRLFWAVVVITLPSMVVIATTWAIHEGRFAWWVLVAWIPWVSIGCQHSNAVRHRNLLNVDAKS